MKEIIARIRFTMQWIMVGCLLLIIPVSKAQYDVVGLSTTAADALADIWPDWKSMIGKPPIGDFQSRITTYRKRKNSESVPTTLKDRQTEVASWPIAKLVSLRPMLSHWELQGFDEFNTVSDVRRLTGVLTDTIPILDRLVKETKLIANATVADLAEAVRARVVLPVIDISIYIERAILWLALALGVLLVYFLSLLSALNLAIKRGDKAEGWDWVFYHPSPLGILLGTGWLLSPATIAAIATFREMLPLTLGIPASATLCCLGILGSWNAIRLRQSVLSLEFSDDTKAKSDQ